MIKLGLTGGIGSGKTTVATIFNSFGIPIYNSDVRAKYIMNNDIYLVQSIKKLLGEEAYQKKQLNRAYISSKVFTNPKLLKKINKLVHPKVREDFENWCNKYSEKPFIIKEAAILIESKAYLGLDKIIVVNAPIDTRINRVLKRDDSNLNAIKNRINNQITEEERNKYADYIINNDGSKPVIKQVSNIIEDLRKIRSL